MANRVMTGFRWRRNLLSQPSVCPPIEILPVATAYATALYLGDPVKLLSTGYITAAAAGDTIYGVFSGAEQYYDGSVIRRGPVLPASTTYGTNLERQSKVRIIPAFGQIFELDADEATTAATEAAYLAFIGENCEWIAGTNNGDESGALLDISTHATTNTLSLRLQGIARHIDTDFASVGVKLLCSVNLLQMPAAGSTTGT